MANEERLKRGIVAEDILPVGDEQKFTIAPSLVGAFMRSAKRELQAEEVDGILRSRISKAVPTQKVWPLEGLEESYEPTLVFEAPGQGMQYHVARLPSGVSELRHIGYMAGSYKPVLMK